MSIKNALEYAIRIIENYELDIKNSKEAIGIDLVKKGFCQGRIYKAALKQIGLIRYREKLRSKCHGTWVYKMPIACCISDIEFGTEEEAEQLINGYYCSQCNKPCEIEIGGKKKD